MNCLAVGVGGFVGAISRYLLSLIAGYYFFKFPLGTMLINLTGAFCIGFITGITPLGILSEQRHFLLAGSYACGSVLLCLGGVWVGKMLAGRVYS